MTQWQDISTYPNDIAIRLIVVKGVVFPACFEHGRWWFVRPRYDGFSYTVFRTSQQIVPTHWMELPRPPHPTP